MNVGDFARLNQQGVEYYTVANEQKFGDCRHLANTPEGLEILEVNTRPIGDSYRLDVPKGDETWFMGEMIEVVPAPTEDEVAAAIASIQQAVR